MFKTFETLWREFNSSNSLAINDDLNKFGGVCVTLVLLSWAVALLKNCSNRVLLSLPVTGLFDN